jgi:hypothetical protein
MNMTHATGTGDSHHGLLAIAGLCAVASAAASGSGKADGNVMSGATRSSLVHWWTRACRPRRPGRPLS